MVIKREIADVELKKKAKAQRSQRPAVILTWLCEIPVLLLIAGPAATQPRRSKDQLP